MAGTTVSGRLTWSLATIERVIPENARTKTLILTVPGWRGHRPGQHMDLRLTAEDGYQAERSYSIASAPDGERIELTVEQLDDGEVSPYLAGELRVSDQIELRGPIGGYFTWEASDGGPLFLVAGGSGIVPLMAMIRHRAAIESHVPTHLLASFRSPGDVIYGDELKRLAEEDPQLEVIFTFTRQPPVGWAGYGRRIDAGMLADAGWPPDADQLAYICGPTPFVENAATALVGLGHTPARIKTERFGPTGG